MNSRTYHIFFRNLANPLKIKIISSLRESNKSVNELSETLKVEQSKISHALSSLKCCNIVESRSEGKKRIYSLNKSTIIPMLDLIDKHSQTFCNKLCSCKLK